MLILYIRKISLCLLTLLLILSLNTTYSISAESTTTSSTESEPGKTHIDKAYPILTSAGNSTSNGIIPIHQGQITKTSNNTEIAPIRSNSRSLGITPVHQWQISPANKNEVFSPCNSKSIGLFPKHHGQTLKSGSNGVESDVNSSDDLTLVSDMLNNTSVSSEVYGSFSIRNKKGLYTAAFTRNSGKGLFSFSRGNANLLMTPINPESVTGTINKNTIIYKNIYPNTNIKYTLERSRLKEDIIVQKYNGKDSFDFQFNANNLVYTKMSTGEIYFYTPGTSKPLFAMAKPYATDNNGKRCDLVNIEITDSQIKLMVDPDWLKKAAYPIIIDPTIYLPNVTFTRPSIAYQQDGTLISTNLPRYNPSKFDQALMIEEGTTNLLSANQSSIETNLDPGYIHDAEDDVITRDTNQAWHGSACLKVVTGTSPWGGVDLWNGEYGNDFPVIEGQTYTASAYLKGESGGELVALQAYASDWTFIYDEYVILTTDWQRASVTFTVPAGKTSVLIIICKADDTGIRTFYADGIQLEQKSYATSWQTGGTNNLLSANQSSIETNLDPAYVHEAEDDVITRDTNQAWHGSACLKVVTGTSPWGGVDLWNKEVGDGFPAIAGQTYTASAYLKGEAGNELVALQAYASDWTFIYDEYLTLTTDWQRASVTFTVPAGKTSIFIIICKADDTGIRTFYADGIQLEQKSHATSWNIRGTNNLLSINQSTIETNLDPGYIHDAEDDVITRDTNQAWHGSACLKVVTGTSPWGGVDLWNGEYGNGFPVIEGQTYTASAFLKGDSGGELVALQAYASDWTIIDDWYATLTTDWQQVSCTFTVPAGKTSVLIIICKVDDTGIRTFYADDIQLEPIGDIPRTAETLTIPTSESLSAEQGSIEVSAYIDPDGVHSANNPNWSTIFAVAELQHSPNLELNQISIRRNPNSTNWKIWFSNASGGTSAIDLGNITSAGWYSFEVTWQASVGGYGYLNGVNMGSVEASYLPFEFTTPLANIGSWVESDYQFDHLIDDLRISNRLRTAEEIQASYQSDQPLPVDADTTIKLTFDNNLDVQIRIPFINYEYDGQNRFIRFITPDTTIEYHYDDNGNLINRIVR